MSQDTEFIDGKPSVRYAACACIWRRAGSACDAADPSDPNLHEPGM